MQINQIKYTDNSLIKRIVSLFLAMVMLISFVLVPDLIVSAEDTDNTGGFILSLAWNSNDTNDETENPSTTYKYLSSKDEERIVTLKVKYSNKQVANYDYEKGRIIITVPGLKQAVRSEESYKAAGVAADEMSNPNKTHDWSYSYTEATDTYTFINNNTVEAKSTFEGSFEIMWRLPSRKTINFDEDYSLEIQGTINANVSVSSDEEENYEAVSNSVYYHQARKRDEYTINETAAYLYKDEIWSGNEAPVEDYLSYTWVNYKVTGTDELYARDVEGSERFDCYFLEGAIVQGAGLRKTGKTRNDFGDGKVYECWSVEKDIDTRSSLYLERVYVAYPPKYSKQEVTNYVELRGTYFDETEETLLADTNETIDLSNYWFRDIPGDIYDAKKHSHGIKNSYIENHCDKLCKAYGAINAAHLSNGSQEYYSTLELVLNFKDEEVIERDESGEPIKTIPLDLTYYDLEFVDDIMDISLKPNGEDESNLRRLTDDEYNFTCIYIPSNSAITNKNKLPIKADTYQVEIYLRYANEDFPYQYLTDKNISTVTPYKTTKIQTNEQYIDLPDNVVGVKIVIRGLKEGFNTTAIRCYYKFHIDDEELSDIITDEGQLINNMYFNLYKMGRSNNYEWFNDDFSRNEYSDDREYDRDMEIYGHPLDRENGTLHILEIPSEFQISNTIAKTGETKSIVEFKGSITSKFKFGEGADLSKFSMYTIIPEGLQLFDIYNTPEKLKEVLVFSGGGMSSAYISEHTTIEVIENYQGSGRQYMVFQYDFSDKPVTSGAITVSGIPMYAEKDSIENQSMSYTMCAGMLIDQQGKWFSDYYDNYKIEDGIWKDIDRDGNTSEYASFSSSKVNIVNPIDSNVELVKFVKTEKTNGFVNPTADEDVPMTYADGIYTYRLRANIGADISVNNFIFFDAIETVEGKEWQGEFVDVDYSYAKEIFGGIEPTVYYSEKVETFDKIGKAYNITPESLMQEGSGWTTTKPAKVRSIAVYFGEDAVAESKSVIYIDINMKAPSPSEAKANKYYDKITINDCAIGYDKINEITGKFMEHNNLPSNNVRVKFVPPMGKIILTKKDSADNQTITAEAEFELYRADSNKLVGTYTTENGKIVAKDLAYGEYYFKEITAPKGYKLSEEILKVELDDEKPDKSVQVEFENKRKTGQISIKKVSDRNENLGLKNAEFAIYNLNDELIQSGLKTDENGELTIDVPEWGEYYLEETKAPDGYNISCKRTYFTINADNDAGRDLSFTIENKQKPAYATLVKYETLENDEQTENVLSGAVYELYQLYNAKTDTENELIGTYMTDKDGKIYAENLDFGEYYFIETIAPKGYELDENAISFTVDSKHTSEALIIKAYDKRKLGKVWLQKLDDEEKYVKGAVYGLFDADTDKQVSVSRTESTDTVFTTSDEGFIAFGDLYWGKYYLKEIKAPTGYELSDEKITFSIDKDTVSKRIILNAEDKRLKGSVELVKCDEKDETKTLAGAIYTLYKNDGSIYRDNLKTDDEGKILVKEIEWGSYYFLEKTAPTGYGISTEKIRFSVNYLTAGKIQEVVATDPPITCKLTVAKKIKISDIVFTHGNPTFTFKVADNNGHTYCQTITFSETYLDDYRDANPDKDYIEASVIFAGLIVGDYTVTEVETNRYETDSIEVTPNGEVKGKSAEFKIDSEEAEYKATFINEKTSNSGTSHSSQVSNILKRQRKLTGVVAEWTGPETITDSELDLTLLTVWAIYDDGNQEKLGDKDYQLSTDTFDTSMNGAYTIEVSYEEGNRTRKDSFVVNIKIVDKFTWEIYPFEEDEEKDGYDGKAVINSYQGKSPVIFIPEDVEGWTKLINGEAKEQKGYEDKKYKVVGVVGNGSKCMIGMKNCERLRLPNGLKTIGDYTFNSCKLLTDVKMPNSVTKIGAGAFNGCEALSELSIGECKVETIGSNAFANCKNLSGKLTIPDSVESIESMAFVNCTSLTELDLGSDKSNLTSIGSSAFSGCTGLTGGLKIPNNVTEIGNSAFISCEKFTGLDLGSDKSNLESIGNSAFEKCKGLTGSLEIPNSVITIGNNAFKGCNNAKLNSLTIGQKVESIGEGAFYSCSNLKGTLDIPPSVKKIGYAAFWYCKTFDKLELHEGLEEISVSMGSSDGYIDKINTKYYGAFNKCTGLKGELTIPNSVKTIGDGAFYQCTKFEGLLTIGENVTSIEDYAFNGCKFKGNLIIPPKVKNIGSMAFANCTGFNTGDVIVPADAIVAPNASGSTGLNFVKSAE